PNVGKSTLLNAFLNEERAIVSDIAGTTRDTIEDEINIGGVRFRFIDTAGIRDTKDVIEAQGVERTREKMRQARLIIYLADPQQDDISEIRSQQDEVAQLGVPFVTVINKTDLLRPAHIDELRTLGALFISAKNKVGVEELKGELLQKVNLHKLNTDDVLVSNVRHVEALQKTQDSLEKVVHGIDNPITSDFL